MTSLPSNDQQHRNHAVLHQYHYDTEHQFRPTEPNVGGSLSQPTVMKSVSTASRPSSCAQGLSTSKIPSPAFGQCSAMLSTVCSSESALASCIASSWTPGICATTSRFCTVSGVSLITEHIARYDAR